MFKLRRLRCSFCRRDENEVAKLVAGPRVYICDQCVTAASRIMQSPHVPGKVEPTIWQRLTERVRRLFHDSKAVSVT